MRIKLPSTELLRNEILEILRAQTKLRTKDYLIVQASWNICPTFFTSNAAQNKIDIRSAVYLAFKSLVDDRIISVRRDNSVILNNNDKFPTLVKDYCGYKK